MSVVLEDKKQAFLANFVAKSTDKDSSIAKKEALKALENLEFPTTRDEYWKYTRVGKITNANYSQSPSFNVADISRYLVEGLEAYLVVFVNGFFSEVLSDISQAKGITICPIAKAMKNGDQVAAVTIPLKVASAAARLLSKLLFSGIAADRIGTTPKFKTPPKK